MKIRQLLKEAGGITAAFAFGRFNPAHQGHIAVWQTVEKSGVKWYIGTNPTTIGPNDPLTFEQKKAWMEEIYPQIQGHIVPEQSVVTLAVKIYNDLGKNEDSTIGYVTDDTDWAWSGKLLNQYNGVEGKHGYYKFAQIVHIPSPRVSSATALRDAARAGDKAAFYHASGTDPKLKVAGKTYFDTVAEACAKYPLPVKKAKKVKEAEMSPMAKDSMKADKIRSLKNLIAIAKEQDRPLRVQELELELKKIQSVTESSLNERASQLLSAEDRNGVITVVVLAPDGTKKSLSNDNPNYINRWLDMKYGLSLPRSITSRFVGVRENNENIGNTIRQLYQQIYDQGDDALEYLNTNAPLFAQYWDQYEGDLDSIIAELSPKNLIRIAKELQQVAGEQGVAEGLSKRDQQDVAAIRAAIERLESQLNQPNVDKAAIQQSIAHEKKRLALYGQGVAEGETEYGPEWDEMVKRLGQKAKEGERKTVWDPEKRVYKTVPVKQTTDEASLATMRDYFAGQDDAKNPLKITQMRQHFGKEADANAVKSKKEFRNEWEYQQWLEKNKLKPMSKTSVKEELKQNWVQRVMEKKK